MHSLSQEILNDKGGAAHQPWCTVEHCTYHWHLDESSNTVLPVTVTGHFITADWKLESDVLLTQEIPEHHTGVHMRDRLRTIAKDWWTQDKVAAVVHNNASSMVLAAELLEDWSDLCCFGRQKSIDIPKHSLVQDVATRCNFAYFMYKHLAEQRWAVYILSSTINRWLPLAIDTLISNLINGIYWTSYL